MPVPNPAEGFNLAASRLALQSAVFCCYLLVAIALLYSAWRISMTSEMIDRVLTQQTAILQEIRDARAAIPAEVKSAIPAVIKGLPK